MTKVKSVEQQKFIIRFPSPEFHSQLKEAAENEFVSMNSFILQAIKEKIARDTKRGAKK